MERSQDLPKVYNFREVEERWQSRWPPEIYYFERNSEKPRYIIDTPPPYPTGNFHIGNALNWCYIDFIARFKRMRGFNVMFPQGWDCHGLPTEVKVEEKHGITKNDVSREEFRRLCRELTRENISLMRKTMIRLGFSIDWSNEYITMLPEYFRKTQISFLQMLRKGYIYQAEHPVNFCTRCETAIAFAEVSYANRRTMLSYLDFDGVEIATTRPELLSACAAVAVHPDDERYRGLKGKRLKVPLFGHEVPVIADESVDPSFGTGAVMICTFGDRQDVLWWKKYDLELRKAIDRRGMMAKVAGRYEGMDIESCRRAVLQDLKEKGALKRQEEIDQRVGTCWRCKKPIEILSERQWFIRVRPQEILDAAEKIQWYPEHMHTRLVNWVSQMEWDWCISRQRIFATPIPVWFCTGCGEMILPSEEELPVDPTKDLPKKACARCGGSSFAGEEDVLDTWMDSSISVLNVTGWDGRGRPGLFPAQLRPQGHDIIRTWAFYTILRSVALVGEKPWDSIVINGMVLGEDGFKMSKSRGNIIDTDEIVGKYGADTFRQWAAASAATGSDIMFSWNDVISASRFQTKLWNIVRFTLGVLVDPDREGIDAVKELADRWLLACLHETLVEVTDAMEHYQFDRALKAIREFTWSTLADRYIELVKGRLYMEGEESESARAAIRCALDTLLRMLAPFAPYMSEECYQLIQGASVHGQEWPSLGVVEVQAKEDGELLNTIVSELRRVKHERGLALNAPFGKIEIFSRRRISDAGDAGRALNAEVRWRTDRPELKKEVKEVIFNMSVIGPALKGRAKAFMEHVRGMPAEALLDPPPRIRIGGDEVSVPRDAFTLNYAYVVEGERVDLLTIGDVIVTIQQTP
ncbi:MAG: valine--tRNA ligase [Methanomicrobiales archaeon]|nr:valine--tRNA ligase [Methanomicrobiales archaeon]